MRRGITAFLLLVFVLSIIPSTAEAQGGIKVWPTSVEFTVGRGESVTKTVNIQNLGSEPVVVQAYVMDFSKERDGNFNFYEPGHESYSASRWLGIDSLNLELAANQSREVEVTVSVPAQVEPGGHYAALFFEAIPLSNEGTVSISTRIPTLFYVTVPGVTEAEVFSNAEIASLLLPGISGGGSLEAGAVIHNSGNVHLTVAAKAYFDGYWGGKSELDLGQTTILPDSDGVLKEEWQEKPFFGKVGAKVVIGYLDQNGGLVNKSQTAEFWVVPWSLVGIILFVMIVVVPAIVILSRRFRLRLERR
ncbi:MAG: molecular chaperone [Chloroflexi bacterium]|nr:molecular chaperone [Chloroflexota bacterium]